MTSDGLLIKHSVYECIVDMYTSTRPYPLYPYHSGVRVCACANTTDQHYLPPQPINRDHYYPVSAYDLHYEISGDFSPRRQKITHLHPSLSCSRPRRGFQNFAVELTSSLLNQVEVKVPDQLLTSLTN